MNMRLKAIPFEGFWDLVKRRQIKKFLFYFANLAGDVSKTVVAQCALRPSGSSFICLSRFAS